MALIQTSQTAIDHKLHRILLESATTQFARSVDLARSIAAAEHVEFSYERNGQTQYTKYATIQRHITYAQTIAILDEDFKPSQKKDVFEELASFQNWLGNKVIQYLNNNGCSSSQIKDTIRSLLQEDTPTLPTPDHVFGRLKPPISRDNFMTSVKLVSLLRPQVFELGSRRLIVNDQIIKV